MNETSERANDKATCEAIRELMAVYDTNRAEWVKRFGTPDGFDAWFRRQVMPAKA
jgi:hypothetical protein